MTGAEGQALCLDSTSAPVAWEVQPEFDLAQLEVSMLSGAFAAGFVIVGTGWAIGRGFKFVLSLLR